MTAYRIPDPDALSRPLPLWPPVRPMPSSVLPCVECGARGTTWVETEAGGHLPACADCEAKVKHDAGQDSADGLQHGEKALQWRWSK